MASDLPRASQLQYLSSFPDPDVVGPPVLAITSDQGSQLFKAALHLGLELKLRLIWFPDINHIEHNVDKGIMLACNLDQLNEKALFLGRLHRGPKMAAGRWHGQIKRAHEAGWANKSGYASAAYFCASWLGRGQGEGLTGVWPGRLVGPDWSGRGLSSGAGLGLWGPWLGAADGVEGGWVRERPGLAEQLG